MTFSLCYCTVVIKGPKQILDVIQKNKLRISRSSYSKRKTQLPDVFDYELKKRTPNEITIGFIVNHSCTPEFLINDLVLRFPCCSASVTYLGDWDETGIHEICSDGIDIYIIRSEYRHIYDYYDEEDQWVCEFGMSLAMEEDNEDEWIVEFGIHSSEEPVIEPTENTNVPNPYYEEQYDIYWMSQYQESLLEEELRLKHGLDERSMDIRYAFDISYDTPITKEDEKNYTMYEEGVNCIEVVAWMNRYKQLIEQKKLKKLERNWH